MARAPDGVIIAIAALPGEWVNYTNIVTAVCVVVWGGSHRFANAFQPPFVHKVTRSSQQKFAKRKHCTKPVPPPTTTPATHPATPGPKPPQYPPPVIAHLWCFIGGSTHPCECVDTDLKHHWSHTLGAGGVCATIIEWPKYAYQNASFDVCACVCIFYRDFP